MRRERRDAAALVLAHSNASGSRHPKRHLDVPGQRLEVDCGPTGQVASASV